MNSDERIARIRALKTDKQAAITARDALAERIAGIRTAADGLGDSPTLSKLVAFLKTIREIIQDSIDAS